MSTVRLWKAGYNYTNKEKLADFLKEHRIGGPETIFKSQDENQDKDIEENTGVSFPGLQLDTYLDQTYKDIDNRGISISPWFDIIAVEQQADDGKFIFQYSKNPGVFGKCEGCYSYGAMKS